MSIVAQRKPGEVAHVWQWDANLDWRAYCRRPRATRYAELIHVGDDAFAPLTGRDPMCQFCMKIVDRERMMLDGSINAIRENAR